MDYGCGSGILSIAAMKLGAKTVTSIDLDPQALLASSENALKNQVTLDIGLPEELSRKNLKADVILSNILAGTLAELTDVFSAHLLPHGKLILSGILKEQTEMIKYIYENTREFRLNFLCFDTNTDEEWAIMEWEKIC